MSTFAAQTGRTLVGRKQGRRKVSRHVRDHPDSEQHGQLRIGQGLPVFVGQLPNGWGEVSGSWFRLDAAGDNSYRSTSVSVLE